ncbi:hypothetical protein ACFLXH_06200 [Chloroflexota bacterium]
MSVQCLHEENGKKCQAYVIKGSEYCFFHDPGSAKKRAEGRKKGGFNRRILKSNQHEYHPIKTVNDVNAILESAINEACSLESSQSQLRTVGYLCHIALKGQELGNLEERVNDIEEKYKKMEDEDEP